jgi:hypothetical protein
MIKPTRLHTTILSLGLFGMLGLGLGLGLSNPTRAVSSNVEAADGQPAGKTAAPEKAALTVMDVTPPPPDINDLSMEVAALRTLYLLNIWPDHNLVGNASLGGWGGIMDRAQDKKDGPTAESHRDRKAAKVSDSYRKVLTDLRAAFIAGQDDRIIDLTEQLEELANDDDPEPELDDAVAITEKARAASGRVLGYLIPEQVVSYLNSYGKEFPNPFGLVGKAVTEKRENAQIPEETRKFVVKEVSWQLGGIDLKQQELISAKVANLLKNANAMTLDERRKAWAYDPVKGEAGKLRKEYGEIKKNINALKILDNVMRQDLAELLSNPRLLPAIEARVAYLKKAGYKVDRKPVEGDDDRE